MAKNPWSNARSEARQAGEAVCCQARRAQDDRAQPDLPMEERFQGQLKLAGLPRNSSATRLHNRCQLTGRPHAYYRKLKLSRIMLRELASFGQIPAW
jgi:ribosomal protein S14